MDPASSFHLLVLVFLATSFFIPGIEAPNCPQGWLRFQGNCYGFNNLRLSWKDAENDCQYYSKQGHLASILSEMEGEMIASHITTNYNQKENVWIGLYDFRGTNHWRWVDYSALHYLSWAKGYPKLMPQGACAQLSYKEGFNKWNSRICSRKANYLCMMRIF